MKNINNHSKPATATSANATAVSIPDLPEHQVQKIIDRLRGLYHQNIAKSSGSRAALAELGFKDQALIERYMVGYCDGNLATLLVADKSLRNQVTQLGVLDDQGKELLVGPVFPVDSADGRRVTLWSCSPDGMSRFLSMRPVPLWNAIAAKHSTTLYVFENPIEALSVAGAGHSNVTALDPNIGEPDHKAISGWGVQGLTVVVSDTPEGIAKGKKIQAKLEPLKSELVLVPDCTSLNELYRTKGAKALAEAIVAATHGLEALEIPGMELREDGFDLTTSVRVYRVRSLRIGLQMLTAVISLELGDKFHLDRVDMLSAPSRKKFVVEIVRLFQVPADHAEAEMIKLLRACRKLAKKAGGAPARTPAPGTVPEADRELGLAFGRDPNLIDLILADYEHFGLIGERANKLLSYFTMSSRKLKRPLAVLTVAISGSGKSAMQEATVLFCPPDEVETVTIFSGKALFHKDRDSLKNKVIAIEEAEGARQADYPLRVIISAGVLTTEVAVKDAVTGKLTTVRNKVEGPVAVLLTTTSLSMNPETISRFFVTSVNDSREHTRAIQDQQRKEHTLEGLAEEQKRPDILRRQHAFQRLLQPVRVVNPLVRQVEFDDDSVSARRELPKRLRLVQAVAFVRQMQKPVKHLGQVAYVEVDEVDLKIARDLMQELFAHHLAELSPMALGLLRQLSRMRTEAHKVAPPADPSDPFMFTCRQARDFTGMPNSSLHRHLKELCAFEFAVREFGRRGQTCLYRLDWEEPAVGLPTGFPPPSQNPDQRASA